MPTRSLLSRSHIWISLLCRPLSHYLFVYKNRGQYQAIASMVVIIPLSCPPFSPYGRWSPHPPYLFLDQHNALTLLDVQLYAFNIRSGRVELIIGGPFSPSTASLELEKIKKSAVHRSLSIVHYLFSINSHRDLAHSHTFIRWLEFNSLNGTNIGRTLHTTSKMSKCAREILKFYKFC